MLSAWVSPFDLRSSRVGLALAGWPSFRQVEKTRPNSVAQLGQIWWLEPNMTFRSNILTYSPGRKVQTAAVWLPGAATKGPGMVAC